jgi:hypothetical protein
MRTPKTPQRPIPRRYLDSPSGCKIRLLSQTGSGRRECALPSTRSSRREPGHRDAACVRPSGRTARTGLAIRRAQWLLRPTICVTPITCAPRGRPPPATEIPGARSVNSAADTEIVPVTSLDSYTAGRMSPSKPRPSIISKDHRRCTTSNNAFPRRPRLRQANSPARKNRTQSFWQQHLPHTLEALRLMIPHPQQFRKRESCQNRVRGVLKYLVFPEGSVDENRPAAGYAGRTR